jgi:tetratricopeptide (TPR) repeat protein
MDNSAPNRLIPLLLVAVTLLTFGRVIVNDFAPYDDEQTIYANGRMNPPQFDRDGILWYWDNPAMSLYAPLTYTVWGVVASVSRVHPRDDPTRFVLDPANFHIASLLLHVAGVLLVYVILARLLRRPWPAAAGALLYGLHPLQVESVAWASGLKDLLSGTLSLATIWLYLRAVTPTSPAPSQVTESDEPAAAARINFAPYLLAILCFALALLAKSGAMMTPFLILIIDVLLLRRGVERTARCVAPFFALAIPAAVIARLVQPGAGVPTVEIWQRPVVAGASLAFYLEKLFLPIGLAFDYGWRPVAMLHKPWFYAAAIIPLVLAVALWTMRRRWTWIRAGVLLFVAALLPVLGLVPFNYQFFSTVADHYVYLAMLGPALIFAWALTRIDARHSGAAACVAGVALLLLGVLSFAQLRFWRDPKALLHRTLAITPDSALALNSLAQIYAQDKNIPEAERLFHAATQSNPGFAPPYVNLLRIYLFQRRADDFIRAFNAFRPVNEALPEDQRSNYPPDLIFRLGQAAASEGKFDDAVRFFQEAARLVPADPRASEALRLAQQKLHPTTAPTPSHP